MQTCQRKTGNIRSNLEVELELCGSQAAMCDPSDAAEGGGGGGGSKRKGGKVTVSGHRRS